MINIKKERKKSNSESTEMSEIRKMNSYITTEIWNFEE